MNLLYVFIGGGVGSLARYGLALFIPTAIRVAFPLATLLSNVLSCVVLGLCIGYFSNKVAAEPSLKVLIITGFCGGFSTFSTFSYETVDMMKNGYMMLAVINIAISMLACFGVVYFLSKNT
jgi:fluoride exporter